MFETLYKPIKIDKHKWEWIKIINELISWSGDLTVKIFQLNLIRLKLYQNKENTCKEEHI